MCGRTCPVDESLELVRLEGLADRLVRKEAHRRLPCAVETVLEAVDTARVDDTLL